MIVYGDHARTADPRRMIDRIRRTLGEAADRRGIVRHDRLVAALMEGGGLAQGLADAEMQALGCDDVSPIQTAAATLLLALADAVWSSWTSDFKPRDIAVDAAMDGLGALPLPASVEVKLPEGFAHYALYPEAFAEAARTLGSATRIIGLRSIGTTLAAMVAVGAGAASFVTLRPVGHPFRREIRVGTDLAADLLRDPACRFAIVDEGPGLSGSSFNAVADWLEDAGVAPQRIVFFPGHAGAPGTEASPRHAARWAGAERRLVSFEGLIAPRLADAVADLTGPAPGPIEDLSGGGWRLGPNEVTRPPVHAAQERRKYRLRAGSGMWLLKFVGLGALSSTSLRRARDLHAAGLGPEPLGVRLGFLVMRWYADAQPLSQAQVDRATLLGTLGRYLAHRSGLPAPCGGATIAELVEMTGTNIRGALGPDAETAWHMRFGDGLNLGPTHRVETDNRLHAWEWLRLADGRLLKTDAIDHHRAHDLIGCQDIAWDIAGARIEFGCSHDEVEDLIACVETARNRPIDRALVTWMTPAYVAFQLGLWTMARNQASAGDRPRIEALLDGYGSVLRTVLGVPRRSI